MNTFIEDSNCESYVQHKMVEYNFKTNTPVDGYTVIINMKKRPPFFGYKKEEKWFDDRDELISNPEDIISFFNFPLPAFFGKRR